MKKLFLCVIFGVWAIGSISRADSADICTFGGVTFGIFDLGSWANANETIIVEEPKIGTGNWLYDLPSLQEELADLERNCEITGETLIRRVSATFPGTLSNAELFYDDQVQECKNHFREIYDIYTGVLCPDS
ncbi:MAG: hypothetical protein OXE94_05490 [Aestuariivita sp.]|nr:hypothetical protein [Aestuariivita sp.]MCY4202034.1 hypothetical protein [Aestuariivita sp.]MCY4288155.1 hypothetical protein [Aestuariivita sp.]MCY4346279.1 hypothetical protein [Aestuariivita sp.]